MTFTILAFVTLFLAIFTPSVALICKWERDRETNAWAQRKQQHAEADRTAAWYLNRGTKMR
jgi:hypothetical protein